MPDVAPTNRRSIAVIGGTFDPPHRGHLGAALAVADQIDVDEVRFMVAGEPYHKADRGPVTEGSVRVEMVRALAHSAHVNSESGVAGHDRFTVDDREVRRVGPTYTVDTLEELAGEFPGTLLYFVIGADAAAGFSTWKSPERIAALSTLVIVNRAGVQNTQLWRSAMPADAHIIEVTMTPVDVSSTEIRSRVATGASAEELAAMTTPEVARIIVDRGIYRVAQ